MPSSPVIVIHYHEAWLKGRNRRFFLARLSDSLRLALEGLAVSRAERPGDRMLIRLKNAGDTEEVLSRVSRVFGIANFALAQTLESRETLSLDALCEAAWRELGPLGFRTFAVRAKRSDKSFPHTSVEIDVAVGRYLLEKLRAEGRDVSVELTRPEITCHIEITPGPAIVYARKIPGAGGMPPNSAGRMTCLLSGGFDSGVAAWRMMRRGAHLSFVHFYSSGARPGESSSHVAREIVGKLVPYQFTARLWLVPLDAIQREVVQRAPEGYRILLYRRMMLRIAERLACRDRSLALITGDSLGQVASQTLQNMVAVGAAASMPVFRPLAGMDKLEILAQARQIGTYEISEEPFHDCCPVFLPRTPALHTSPGELEAAEAKLGITALVRQGVLEARAERFRYVAGRVESFESDGAENRAQLREISTTI
jgi:thiamine biosynthesis protein ThiI